MTGKTQREVFLLLTIIGSFVSLASIALGIFNVVNDWHSIASEIVGGDGTALIGRIKANLRLSVLAGGMFLGSWFSYRRYHKLTFGSQ